MKQITGNRFLVLSAVCAAGMMHGGEASTYRHFKVVEESGKVVRTEPVRSEKTPLWAKDVRQESYAWSGIEKDKPFFKDPIPFVRPPVEGSGEPFGSHNHCPAITWCDNGDLLAIWYSTEQEQSTGLTMLAARLRAGASEWDASSEFFKAAERNMHGDGLIRNGAGKLFHFNGMGLEGVKNWKQLALLLRESSDNGVTWSAARPVSSGANYALRHMPIAGGIETGKGWLIQLCDATWGGEGPSAMHISRDGGLTWQDAGGDIRGIHAGVVELKGDRLLAFGRAQAIDGCMPRSLSDDFGASWTYSATPFPPIGGGQRLVLRRLNEGPLLFVSFANGKPVMTFKDSIGRSFEGRGLFAALSFDEGQSWPVRKLITPGAGKFNGGAWTQDFEATPDRAEPKGYLAATQTPDGVIHLISSRLHYRFNLAWLKAPVSCGADKVRR